MLAAKKAKKLPANVVLHVELDRELVQAVESTLLARGTDIATYIRLQLRAFKAAKTLLNLGDQMTFGKYTGEPVEAICRADPGYMDWLIINGRTARFDVDVLQFLKALDDAAKSA